MKVRSKMTSPALQAIGWNIFFENQLDMHAPERYVIARVSAHYSTEVVVTADTGEFRVPVKAAEAQGKVTVGDWLLLNETDHRAIRLLARKTLLYRKAAGEEGKTQLLVANVDTVFIVTSCNEDFNLSRIERYLAMAFQAGATPVVVLTKADLHEDPSSLAQQAASLHDGLDVVVLDARHPEQARVLSPWCGPGQSVAVLGSSGVGKSTLANALGASGQSTGGIREQDAKGRHTTTARSLHKLPTGGVLVDNPGVREFQLPDCDDGVADLFEDILELIAMCRFSDCKHSGEPGCAVLAALTSGELNARRYASFAKLNEEQDRNAKLLAKRQERDAAKSAKSMAAKKGRRREER